MSRKLSHTEKRYPTFEKGFETGYRAFEFDVMLRHARERAEVTTEAIACKLRIEESAMSRVVNHAEDIRLSTLEKYANALGGGGSRGDQTTGKANERAFRPFQREDGRQRPERPHYCSRS